MRFLFLPPFVLLVYTFIIRKINEFRFCRAIAGKADFRKTEGLFEKGKQLNLTRPELLSALLFGVFWAKTFFVLCLVLVASGVSWCLGYYAASGLIALYGLLKQFKDRKNKPDKKLNLYLYMKIPCLSHKQYLPGETICIPMWVPVSFS